jgi:DNA-directed RNA polymerase subunit K/omega
MSIQTLDIEKFEKNAANLYEAVVVTSTRSKQINDELRMEFNQRLEPIVTKETEDDTIHNEDKLNMSVEFEKREKPTDQAIKEMIDGDISFRMRDSE